MLKLIKVAVTGGLSCGKSTFCRFLKDCGAAVINADEIVHQQLSPNTRIGQEVVKLLGSEIVREDHLDRTLIAKKVFNNPEYLKKLEVLLHPAVHEEIEKYYQQIAKAGTAKVFIAEVPLLYETGGEKQFHKTIVVAADAALSRNRFNTLQQNSNSYEQRALRQMPLEEKLKRADYVVWNNGNLSDLEHAAKQIYQILVHTAE